MHLKKIKLAGFKSFVDPISLPLPSHRMVIVGPNGCGKSNIIDAVRWVMGESSAKHLRGDSMVDVIFNGSSSRKPVGQCSVELVFDNSEGSLGGQYATYSEIAIKRQVSRDGQSLYFLNGARCRRRDITDIFLGTGLGPRSYAIIEQGMISHLIGAKPEELRHLLEEAAGISKYKERRRETETRMHNTTENLDRINDLRDEVDRQLNTLKRQAKNAEKYQELKRLERETKAQIQALRWRSLDEEARGQNQEIERKKTDLEALIANLRQLEASVEQQREDLQQTRDKTAEVQEAYYSQGTEIARVEQQLRHEREQWTRHQQEREQIEHHLTRVQQTQSEQSAVIEQTQQTLENHGYEQTRAQQYWQQAQEVMETAETSIRNWQLIWEDFNQRAAKPTQSAQVERTRQQQLERQQQQLRQRCTRLEEETRGLSGNDDGEELDSLREERFILEQQTTQRQEALATCAAQISENRSQERQFSRELHSQQGSWHQLQGRLASLQALQKAALGRNSKGEASAWLEQQGLMGHLRLAEGLEVEPGWEQAVERVLGMHLEAVCVERLEPLADQVLDLKKGSLVLFDTTLPPASSNPTKTGVSLLNKVRSPWSLDSLLAGVYAVETLAEALALRSHLAPGESVITRGGVWLGACWLSLVCEGNEKLGVLARGREIEHLQQEVAQCQQKVKVLEQELEKIHEHLQILEGEREQHQSALQASQRELRERQSALARAEAEQEQYRLHRQRNNDELNEIQRQSAENEQERQWAEERLQEALAAVERLAEERERLTREKEQLWVAVNQARGRATAAKDTVHQLEMEGQTLQTTQKVAQEAMVRARQEYDKLIQRREVVEAALTDGQTPLEELQAWLETQLQQRIDIEHQLNKMREQAATREGSLQTNEQEKHRAEKAIEEQRTALEQLRIDGQTIRVRAQTLREQLNEEGFNPEIILQNQSEQRELPALEAESKNIAQRIQRLGPINLAAIDECQVQAERKQYLDSQYADLMEALQTLGNAIQRIDRETRSRFQETFDNINRGLQILFPKLFGGGKAYLELSDDDLLNAGVKIMARPPGKRNSTIHLLSGGEKALTAMALVFAIFQLNPAPFCMLDEVDAPLDDANVGRFCDLVKELSEKVQFIIVTHNKATMEIGHQLTGVTMHEPGVSRLVAVDVDEAVQLATI